MVEHPQQRSIKVQDIEDAARLRVQTKLRPSKHLAKLLQRPESTRHCDERVGQVCHERLALVHRADDMEFREPRVPDLTHHQVFRDDSLRLASRLQYGVRQHTHQTHIAAAVHQTDIPTREFRAQFLGGSAVLGTASLTGTKETKTLFPDTRERLAEYLLHVSDLSFKTSGCAFAIVDGDAGEHAWR